MPSPAIDAGPFEVTHVSLVSSQTGRWVPMDFVTREVQHPERFHFGFDLHLTFTPQEIWFRAENGAIHALPVPMSITPDQRIWLDEHGKVWLAALDEPERDQMPTGLRVVMETRFVVKR